MKNKTKQKQNSEEKGWVRKKALYVSKNCSQCNDCYDGDYCYGKNKGCIFGRAMKVIIEAESRGYKRAMGEASEVVEKVEKVNKSNGRFNACQEILKKLTKKEK